MSGHATACPNCGAALQGPWCHACGQKEIHPGDLSLKHAGHHLFHETFHLDGRLWTSLKAPVATAGKVAVLVVFSALWSAFAMGLAFRRAVSS